MMAPLADESKHRQQSPLVLAGPARSDRQDEVRADEQNVDTAGAAASIQTAIGAFQNTLTS